METTELTEAQLDKLREKLQKLRDELQAQVPPGSDADDGTHTTSVRLKKVQAALHKFPGGDYGFCEECEEPIGFKRLEAHPETPVCAECQAARTDR